MNWADWAVWQGGEGTNGTLWEFPISLLRLHHLVTLQTQRKNKAQLQNVTKWCSNWVTNWKNMIWCCFRTSLCDVYVKHTQRTCKFYVHWFCQFPLFLKNITKWRAEYVVLVEFCKNITKWRSFWQKSKISNVNSTSFLRRCKILPPKSYRTDPSDYVFTAPRAAQSADSALSMVAVVAGGGNGHYFTIQIEVKGPQDQQCESMKTEDAMIRSLDLISIKKENKRHNNLLGCWLIIINK